MSFGTLQNVKIQHILKKNGYSEISWMQEQLRQRMDVTPSSDKILFCFWQK